MGLYFHYHYFILALPVLGLLLGLSVDPTWKARLDVRSLWIEGHMNDVNGAPAIDKGLLHLAASGAKAENPRW